MLRITEALEEFATWVADEGLLEDISVRVAIVCAAGEAGESRCAVPFPTPTGVHVVKLSKRPTQ